MSLRFHCIDQKINKYLDIIMNGKQLSVKGIKTVFSIKRKYVGVVYNIMRIFLCIN